MQNFIDELSESDRPVVRKWRLATFGFYGSILAGMILYAVLHRDSEVNYASADSAVRAKTVSASGVGRAAPSSR